MHSAQQAQVAQTNNNNEQVQYTQEERDAAEKIFQLIIKGWWNWSANGEDETRFLNLLKKYPKIINFKGEVIRNRGFTALILAAKYDESGIVEFLIKAGANLDAKDDNENTALIWAASNCSADIVKLLIDAGADINAQDDTKQTALMETIRQGSLNEQCHGVVAQLLIEAGANLDLQSDYGQTALMYAARNGLAGIIKMLIAAGADQTLKDEQERTAADIAQEMGFKKLYEKVIREVEAERARYQKRQKAAHQEIAQQIFPEEIEELGITEIITDYAYDPKNTEDLPEKSLGGRSTKCTIQ